MMNFFLSTIEIQGEIKLPDFKVFMESYLFQAPWNDFTLLHQNKSYNCNSIMLKAISPVIKKLESNSFTLPSINGSVHEVLLAMFGNNQFSLSPESENLFIASVIVLDIQSLKNQILNYFHEKSPNPDKFYTLFKDLFSQKVPTEDLLPIISSNFDDYFNFLKNEEDDLLLVHVFNSLEIQTDNSLPHQIFSFLLGKFKQSPAIFNQSLTNIASKFMNQSFLRQLLLTPSYDLNPLKDQIIPLIARINGSDASVKTRNSLVFDYSGPGSEFKGLFHYLDVNQKLSSYVLVTASSEYSSNFSAQNTVGDGDERCYFSSHGGQVEYLTFRLIGCTLKPTGYSMKSWYFAQNGVTPVSWQLDASIDESNWYTIHSVTDSMDLVGNHKSSFYNINGVEMDSFSYFRLTQLKSGSTKNPIFALAKFELFGIFYDQTND
ncbi:hypothetical protein TRFO_06765 [Tritrichomonas foetus]|uniref:F5/8 type C domain-containing protein n=1 Tax=Tritrichomonas foetus TaxID=1144522 RepID=A0A1J4K051_9EUKA|nr:hypothetical protein TRFO_06765 [Tritrichomonas foetus]|eukprot:OHT03118.1 hypothetical protein TRFO_06765 [Tritrichomonas foetus]